MAAPNQSITKYVELYDRLCEKMMEDNYSSSKESKLKIAAGSSDDELQEYFVSHRKKWAFMDKMASGMKTHKVSKATLAEVRAILGDELDQYM